MFALRVRYLMGRVYAADFEDGDDKRTVEWPPHPSRLFSALVASWGEGGAEHELRPVLEWLGHQAPPALLFGPCFPRHVSETHVIVNDQNGTSNFLGFTMTKGKKARRFPSASLLDPEVWFVWAGTLPSELESSLQVLLRRTPSLGHSASLVSLEIALSVPEGLDRLEPDQTEGVRLRVASPNRFRMLEASFKKFQANPSKVYRPSRGATTLYAAPTQKDVTQVKRGVFRHMVILRRLSGERIPLTGALALTSAFRGALIAQSPQPPPESITGHAARSSAELAFPSEQPHVALVPLPFVEARQATGEILGVAALLPHTLSEADRNTVLVTLTKIRELRMAFGVWQVELTNVEEPRLTLQTNGWIRKGRAWATVTPFVFDRFPGDPFGEEAQNSVRLSFERVGLPRPSSVSLMKTAVFFGVPPSSKFPHAAVRLGKPKRYHIHVLVTFDRQIAGPIIAGAGRFYGYGLFRPIEGE